MRKSLLLTIVLFLSSAVDAMHIELGFVERPPYIYVNADGSIRGSMGKKIAGIFEQARVEVDWVRYRPNEIAKLISNNDAVAYLATPNLALNSEVFFYSEKPLFTLQFFTYRLANTKQVSSLQDTHNTTVAMPLSLDLLQGDIATWLTTPEHGINVIPNIRTLQQGIPLLKSGKADYYFTYISPNTISMRFSGAKMDEQLRVDVIYSAPMNLVLRKTAADADIIMQRINNVLVKEE